MFLLCLMYKFNWTSHSGDANQIIPIQYRIYYFWKLMIDVIFSLFLEVYIYISHVVLLLFIHPVIQQYNIFSLSTFVILLK